MWTKFGSLVQNNMHITVMWSQSKPEVEFLYGERLFFKSGSSYIAAVNRDMSPYFHSKWSHLDEIRQPDAKCCCITISGNIPV